MARCLWTLISFFFPHHLFGKGRGVGWVDVKFGSLDDVRLLEVTTRTRLVVFCLFAFVLFCFFLSSAWMQDHLCCHHNLFQIRPLIGTQRDPS